MTSRRYFLKNSAVAMFGIGTAPAWLASAAYARIGAPRKKVLVAIFQRGGADGLNMVVPFGDKRYYELRPSIAVRRPDGTEDGAVDLDGFFGLHPSLAPLKPIYQAGHLAIVEAVGSPDPTRSHFDAQDYIESGTPGNKATTDGWLNRALIPRAGAPPRAVSIGAALPQILLGGNGAVTVPAPSGAETSEAEKLIGSIQRQSDPPGNGAEYTTSRFGESMRQIARMIEAGTGLEVAFADIGGWDTHVNQVGPKSSVGRLPALLSDFSRNLAAFYRDLGDRMADVALVTMSEFGRAARENDARGTDHGHANVMFVMGGEVKGGKVYGDWPGLEPEQLYQSRDLNRTTDFRDVLAELVAHQLGNPRMGIVFPGYGAPKYRGLMGRSAC
jgi:uncharacterized protein (DUF1501 family)